MKRSITSGTAAAVLQELTALEVDYWFEVDQNYGREAHTMYVDGGLFAIGDKPMQGHEAIKGFYSWREKRGDRTARHVVTNFRLSWINGNRATFECILLLYADDGKPVLPSKPAIMIADIFNECERGFDGEWRYVSHRLVPIFEGGVGATIPQN